MDSHLLDRISKLAVQMLELLKGARDLDILRMAFRINCLDHHVVDGFIVIARHTRFDVVVQSPVHPHKLKSAKAYAVESARDKSADVIQAKTQADKL
jgi:hypothetical protein